MPSSLAQAPLSSGSFQEVDQGSLHLPGFFWEVGSGLEWGGYSFHLSLSLSAFLVFNKVGSKQKSSAWGRERKGQELWESLPKCPSSLGNVLPGRTS